MKTDPKIALENALSGLREDRQQLDRQIAALEGALQALIGPTRTRGRANKRGRASKKRRTMNTAQKQAVSKRMKAYWAARRAEKKVKKT